MKYFFALPLLCAANLAVAETITMNVPDITCAACAQVIKESFAKVHGVTSTTVDVKSKTVIVRTEKGIDLSDAEITKALSEYQYTAKEMRREP